MKSSSLIIIGMIGGVVTTIAAFHLLPLVIIGGLLYILFNISKPNIRSSNANMDKGRD